jgi:hypothetical protein
MLRGASMGMGFIKNFLCFLKKKQLEVESSERQILRENYPIVDPASAPIIIKNLIPGLLLSILKYTLGHQGRR